MVKKNISEIIEYTKVRDMSTKKWYKGSALYYLPGRGIDVNDSGFLTSTNYIIVAVTPRAVDHGQKETTVFLANKDGSLFGGFWDKDSDDPMDHTYVERFGMEPYGDGGAELSQCRIVGEYNHHAAIQKIYYPPPKKMEVENVGHGFFDFW